MEFNSNKMTIHLIILMSKVKKRTIQRLLINYYIDSK